MNYWTGVGAVMLVQLAVSGGTIAAGTGNGSFVGLGAMLIALYGVPITAIMNALVVRNHRRRPQPSDARTLLIFSSVVPALQLGLLAAQIAFDL